MRPKVGFSSPSKTALNRFQSPNMLHRTLQAVFESVIYFDRARHKSIGSHYGRIINGLAKLFGFEVGSPRTVFLSPGKVLSGTVGDRGRVQRGIEGDQQGSEDGDRNWEQLQAVDLSTDVFANDSVVQDGLYVFTIGKDGDQHATAIAKAGNEILLLEPNQGLLFFDATNAEELRSYLEVYENLAARDGVQRHRGKLYPVVGIVMGDEELLQLAENANERA
eukprot:g6989.t1